MTSLRSEYAHRVLCEAVVCTDQETRRKRVTAVPLAGRAGGGREVLQEATQTKGTVGEDWKGRGFYRE